jgi:hypothetical protein
MIVSEGAFSCIGAGAALSLTVGYLLRGCVMIPRSVKVFYEK